MMMAMLLSLLMTVPGGLDLRPPSPTGAPLGQSLAQSPALFPIGQPAPLCSTGLSPPLEQGQGQGDPSPADGREHCPLCLVGPRLDVAPALWAVDIIPNRPDRESAPIRPRWTHRPAHEPVNPARPSRGPPLMA